MRKALLVFLCVLLLSGCFDYRGLEDQAILTGIAVDRGDEGYTLTIEIADVSNVENGQFGSMFLTATGKTFADALDDARQKLHEDMYLGTLKVIILSREVAEGTGLMPFAAYLLHDLRVRNSLPIAVAGGETAGELLTPSEGEERQVIVSTILGERLGRRSDSVETPAIHEIYSALLTGEREIVLPLVTVSEVRDILFELDGSAQFRDGHLMKER